MPHRKHAKTDPLQLTAVVLIILLGAVLAILLLCRGDMPKPKPTVQGGGKPYTDGCVAGTPEGFAPLTVAEGSFGYRMNTVLRFADPQGSAWLLAENPAENNAVLRIVIKAADGNTLCDSGYITPGSYLPCITPKCALPHGETDATAYLVRYTGEPLQQQEVFTEPIRILVGDAAIE